MFTRKRILVLLLIVTTFLMTGSLIYYFVHQLNDTRHSLLLYTSYPSKERTTNWVFDTNTGKKWEVGNNMEAGRWSASGKYISFYTYTYKVSITTIWVSDSNGQNLRQVFDGVKYPDLKIKGYAWLSDQKIIVNVVKDFQSFAYLLDINSPIFEKIPNSTGFIHVSPNGQFWVEFNMQNKYSLFNLDEKRTPLSQIELWDHFFSPNGTQIAYGCAGKYKFSSLCIADISMVGIANERKVAEDAFLNASGDTWWSPDGKYIGFMYSPGKSQEEKFRTIDVSNGATVYDWIFPTKTTLNFWSPYGDKIIDEMGLMLDLKTGKTSNFFAETKEIMPSHIVDWRLIEVP